MNDYDVFKNKNTILARKTPKIIYYFYIIMFLIFLSIVSLILWY